MPNNISNKLKIIGTSEQINDVMECIKNDEVGYGIDFNKITPMPKWVYGNSPDVTGISAEDERKYGKDNTYISWARKNWGTKWNAYALCPTEKEGEIYFETAWVGVPELMKKIAWMFPDVEIEYKYADEDLGNSNNGIYRFKGIEVLEEEFPFQSKESYELGFELVHNGEVPEYFRFNDEINNYEYVGD